MVWLSTILSVFLIACDLQNGSGLSNPPPQFSHKDPRNGAGVRGGHIPHSVAKDGVVAVSCLGSLVNMLQSHLSRNTVRFHPCRLATS